MELDEREKMSLLLLLLCLLILEGGKEREREKETFISCLLYMLRPGIKPATKVCVLTGNQTCNFWCPEQRSNKPSHLAKAREYLRRHTLSPLPKLGSLTLKNPRVLRSSDTTSSSWLYPAVEVRKLCLLSNLIPTSYHSIPSVWPVIKGKYRKPASTNWVDWVYLGGRQDTSDRDTFTVCSAGQIRDTVTLS